MTESKIFVTGGSGKAGKHLIPYLLEKGYSVVNADLVPLLMDGVDNINLDIHPKRRNKDNCIYRYTSD